MDYLIGTILGFFNLDVESALFAYIAIMQFIVFTAILLLVLTVIYRSYAIDFVKEFILKQRRQYKFGYFRYRRLTKGKINIKY
jgi:hypothetical protein